MAVAKEQEMKAYTQEMEARVVEAPDALALVPEELAKRHRLLPLRWDAEARRLTVAIADTDDIVALDKLRSILPEENEDQAAAFLARHAGFTRAAPDTRLSPASTATDGFFCAVFARAL